MPSSILAYLTTIDLLYLSICFLLTAACSFAIGYCIGKRAGRARAHAHGRITSESLAAERIMRLKMNSYVAGREDAYRSMGFTGSSTAIRKK